MPTNPTATLSHFIERATHTPKPVGKEWEVILIEAGWSKNVGEGGRRRYYPADVLRKAIHLFEGLPACVYHFGDKFDHLPDEGWQVHPDGYASNTVGVYQNVRFSEFQRPDGTKGEGLIANLHILKGHQWLRENMLDAWEQGAWKLFQFSIDAEGEASAGTVENQPAEIVTELVKAASTDVVSRGAAGGAVNRLVASEQDKSIIALIREHRSKWMDGIENAAEGENETDHAIHVLEANLAHAQARLWEIDEDPKAAAFQDQSRGVKALQDLIRMLRNGQVQEAMRLLTSWIAGFSADDAALSPAGGIHSFPDTETDAAPQGNTPPAAQAGAAKETEMSEQTTDQTQAATADADTKTALERVKELEDKLTKREKRLTVKERVSDSGLPKTAQERVMVVLEAALLDATDESVDAAIQTERDYIASLKESGQITGLGNGNAPATDAKVIKDQHEKFVDAWMGYFDGKDENDVPRFHSFREGYWKITEAMGSKVPLDTETQSKIMWLAFQNAISPNEHTDAREHLEMLRESWGSMTRGLPKRFRESIDTASLPVAFGEAFDRRLQRAYTQDPRQDYKELVGPPESLKDLNNKKHIIRVGAFNDLLTIAEKAAYPEITPVTPTEEEALLGVEKHGGTVIVSWEAMLADQDNFIRMIPARMGMAAIRTLQKAAFDPLESNPVFAATSNNFISAGHNNIVVGTLTFPNLVTAVEQMRNQTELDSGEKLGLVPDTLWVPVELEQEAVEILESDRKVTTGEDSTLVNFINRLGLKIRVSLALGLVAGTTDQAYLTARKGDSEGISVGFLNGREEPEVFRQSPQDTPNVGLAFSADQMTLKIRHVWGVIPVDFRFVQGLIP